MSHAPGSARLPIAEARAERSDNRAELPILHLIARRLTDRSDLLYGLLGRADEVTRPEPGSRPPVRMPPTHDFRFAPIPRKVC
jgi:error-prone DNA polymerase